MIQENTTCKACGGTTFAKGEVNAVDARLMPIGKTFSFGSPVIYTFCKKCGEVVSIRVKNPDKF
ncbi:MULTISPECIES: hypothetical protein [unclassified Paenibacillus]|uniref:hypothetical protein n=1 Tax=unclassified Paenibacillus TaxID=185978 RepID=UPI00096E4664|nr:MULTISPECIES: hypothetical protein [unclassified Paenibacillus]OMF85895.1 hypothetical protein BK147_31205 [Paenibacillus sp. FSL R7-0337]